MRLNPDESNSVHRVQVIQCRQGDDELYEETDLGDAKDFSHEPLFIWGGGVTMVGKMRDKADHWRTERTLAVRYGLEIPDLHGLLMQATDERWKVAHHTSVSGPVLTRQR